MTLGYTTVYIEVVNNATALSQPDCAAIVKAMTAQANGTFAHVWEMGPTILHLVDPRTAPLKHVPLLSFFDDADQAGALGYHDMGPDGEPLGKIFVKTTLADGNLVSTTASHELLEMRINPFLVGCAQMSDTEFVALEDCDAPEDDQFGYLVGGVKMSDFVYPSFFDPNGKPPFDRMGHVTAPFQILAGGYMSVWSPGTGWQQRNGASRSPKHAYAMLPRVGSRRERIYRGPNNRIPSTYETREGAIA